MALSRSVRLGRRDNGTRRLGNIANVLRVVVLHDMTAGWLINELHAQHDTATNAAC
jgi:hypothetical protein